MMRVFVAGAGSVGRSIARELLAHGHQVTIADKDPAAMKVASVPEADWLLADANELHSLNEAQLDRVDVVVAATGDDKANLVLALLAKSEFGVPRVVGRVNNPKNEWMFDQLWGVDVAVSTPRIMTALVEEAVAIGDVVRIFTFRQSDTDLVESTLPENSPLVGRQLADCSWPANTVLVAVIRDARPMAPDPDEFLEGRDQLVFVAARDSADALQHMLRTEPHVPAEPTETEPAGD
ncbi:MAG: TrkA family potassium uptake protein [Bifidobacteriaceae bacterium]|jgi:trk system potassium uptake protein TrkA|nr:TrkA family potassium uptake protein [Bifidobacteriaceae bacterium]